MPQHLEQVQKLDKSWWGLFNVVLQHLNVGAMEGPKSKIETPQIHSPWQWVMICEKIPLFIYNT